VKSENKIKIAAIGFAVVLLFLIARSDTFPSWGGQHNEVTSRPFETPPPSTPPKTDTPKKYSIVDAEVPLTYYGEVDGVGLGYQVVPHTVAYVARSSFYPYDKTGNESELERALFLTEYLISNSASRNNNTFIVWENNFPWPVYDLPAGWIGALSQAGCLKSLLLAYKATGEERYLEYGDKALQAFTVDVSQGGLLIIREENWWYPEYAKEEPPFVLNGFITTVLWIKDYYDGTKNPLAKELYDEGVKTLVHYVPTYDSGDGWSYYDAVEHKSSEHYHQLHVQLMGSLFNVTGEPVFLGYHEKWK